MNDIDIRENDLKIAKIREMYDCREMKISVKHIKTNWMNEFRR